MPASPIGHNSMRLALIALCTATLVATIYWLTKDDIARQMRVAQEHVLLQIIPGVAHDNALLDDTLPVGPRDAGLGLKEAKHIYRARHNGEVVAILIPVVAPDGFTGDIDLLVGINRDGSVTGVRALGHRETPGMGDRIEPEKSTWILDFNGRSLANTTLAGWAVKKDHGAFDQFTGATITPRAVVAAIRRALEFAEANKAILFGDDSADTSGRDT